MLDCPLSEKPVAWQSENFDAFHRTKTSRELFQELCEVQHRVSNVAPIDSGNIRREFLEKASSADSNDRILSLSSHLCAFQEPESSTAFRRYTSTEKFSVDFQAKLYNGKYHDHHRLDHP